MRFRSRCKMWTNHGLHTGHETGPGGPGMESKGVRTQAGIITSKPVATVGPGAQRSMKQRKHERRSRIGLKPSLSQSSSKKRYRLIQSNLPTAGGPPTSARCHHAQSQRLPVTKQAHDCDPSSRSIDISTIPFACILLIDHQTRWLRKKAPRWDEVSAGLFCFVIGRLAPFGNPRAIEQPSGHIATFSCITVSFY